MSSITVVSWNAGIAAANSGRWSDAGTAYDAWLDREDTAMMLLRGGWYTTQDFINAQRNFTHAFEAAVNGRGKEVGHAEPDSQI
jgi:hypothetical protein